MRIRRIVTLMQVIILVIRFAVMLPSQFLHLKKAQRSRFSLKWADRRLCLTDAVISTPFDRHYIYHTAWASRILANCTALAEHVDISSSLYFVANASAFVPIRFYDYRPADLELSGVSTGRADLMNLPFPDGSIQSLSCMHVVEHIGLGRYGDTLNYDGDLVAVAELKRVTASQGQLLFVVPLGGKSKIIFNAHRIYTYQQIIAMFDGFDLLEFSLIQSDENKGGLIRNAAIELANQQEYACGCFHFRKK